MTTLRIPTAVAARQGISGVVAAAADQRVALTSHGRVVAVVDSAARLDEDLLRVRVAALAVLDAAADLVSQRSSTFSLDEVCARLGVDAGKVRALAQSRAEGGR
jgi:hypothetical protein